MGFLQSTYFQIAAIVVAVLLLLLLILLARRRHRGATAEAELRPAATTGQQAMGAGSLGEAVAGEPLLATPATPLTPKSQTPGDSYRGPSTASPVGAGPLLAVLSSMIASSDPLTDGDFRRLAIYRPDRVLEAMASLASTVGSDKQAAAQLSKLAAIRQQFESQTTSAQQAEPADGTQPAMPVQPRPTGNDETASLQEEPEPEAAALAEAARKAESEPETLPVRELEAMTDPDALPEILPEPEVASYPEPEGLLEVMPEAEELPEVLPEAVVVLDEVVEPEPEPELEAVTVPEPEADLEPELEAVLQPLLEPEREPETVTGPDGQREGSEVPIVSGEPSTPEPPWMADTMPMIAVVERELPLEAWKDEPSATPAEPMPLEMWESSSDETVGITSAEASTDPEKEEAPEPLPSADQSFPIETGLTAQQFLELDNGGRASAIRHLSETELAKALHDSEDPAVKKQIVDRLEELGSSEALLALGEFLESPTSADMQSYALGAAERLLNTHPER